MLLNICSFWNCYMQCIISLHLFFFSFSLNVCVYIYIYISCIRCTTFVYNPMICLFLWRCSLGSWMAFHRAGNRCRDFSIVRLAYMIYFTFGVKSEPPSIFFRPPFVFLSTGRHCNCSVSSIYVSWCELIDFEV